MAKYRITGPDGGTYEVTAPDDASEQDVLAYVQRNASMTPPKKASASEKGFLQSAHETLRDSVTGIGQGASFNFADEVQGALATPIELVLGTTSGQDDGKGVFDRIGDAYGRGRDRARARVTEAEERSPVATTVGNVAGGVATGGTLSNGGVTLLNAAKPTYTSMIGRGAAEGAAYGAAYGFGDGEGVDDRLRGAAFGAGTGAVAGGGMGAVGAKLANNAANKTIPSADVLAKESAAAYKAVDQAGITIAPKSFDQMVDDVAVAAKVAKINDKLHPDSAAALEMLVQSKGQSPTLTEIDQLRQILADAAKSPKPGDRRIASIMIDKLDNFVDGLTATDVAGGVDPLKAVSALNKARETYAMRMKAQTIAEAFNAADLRAASTGSGGNLDNTIRQNIRAILSNPKKSRGFTSEEREMMEKVVRGGSLQNFMRWVGKLSPEGNGLMTMLQTIGGVATGGATVPLAVVGFGAKKFADTATPRNVEALSRIIRSGGNLPQVQMLPAQQRALLESMLVGGSQQGVRLREPEPAGLLGTIP